MNTKNLMVSFVVIVMALCLVSTVSAIAGSSDVTIDGIDFGDNPAVVAGETIAVKVYFTADVSASEVVIKVELGENTVRTSKFDIESDETYRKTLNIKVPYDFDEDELSTEMDFEIEISADDEADEYILEDEELTVQRPSYNVEIKPIHVPSTVEAGEKFSVDIIVENNGYNDLDDLYITARISELDVEETFYIGDLEVDEDDNTMHTKVELEVPYDAVAGSYDLEVEVSNEDANIASTVLVVTKNSLPNQVIKSGNDLIIVNPTDKVAVYTVVAESPASVSESTVVVESGSSERVTVSPNTAEEFTVSVFSAEGELISTIAFSGSETSVEELALESPVVVLTVVLAIIFLVLLVVLIVLITKKPEKAEEFGESYY